MNLSIILIGIMILLLGIAAASYTVTNESATEVRQDIPFQTYSLPLIFIGAIIIIVGFFSNERTRQKKVIIEETKIKDANIRKVSEEKRKENKRC